VLDLAAGELLTADGRLAGLRKQALEVLLLLGGRAGQVVTKDELMAAVWPRVVVGDGSLTQAVADIRKVLDDKDHRRVRNVARRGYMLVPDAVASADASSGAAPVDAGAGAADVAGAGVGSTLGTIAADGDTAPPPVAPISNTAVPSSVPRPSPAAIAPPARRSTPRPPALIGAVLLVVAIAVVAWLGWDLAASRWLSPQAAARPPLPGSVPALSIAVLPLTVEGDAEGADWLADALHGDLITELARETGRLVIARDTMATYQGKAVDPRQVARELGVRQVVRGSVRREGDQIRLNVALVDGETGVQRWGDTFVAPRAELPRTLNDFSVQIERALTPEVLRVSVAQREALSPDQVTADDLASRAYALWFRGFNRDNVMQALALVERAVQLDRDSQRGWNGVAYLNLHAALNGWQPDRAAAFRRIETAAAELERIDREGYPTYNVKTIILFWKGEIEAMLRHTRAWIERHPNYPQAHGAYGAALMFNGRFDEAAPAFERALRLSPRDAFRAEWHYRLSMSHFSAGRYELASDWSQTAARTNPGLRWPPVHAAALWQMGRHDEARQALADYEARHGAFQPAQARARFPGNEPRFAAARDRLLTSLAQAAVRDEADKPRAAP